MSAIASFVEAAQDAVGAMMVDSSEIDFTYTDATPALTGVLINGSVAYARIVNAAALSILGRSANSIGVLADIAAAADDRILRRTASTINFGQLTAGMFPALVVPDAALSANVPLLNASNIFTGTTQRISGTSAAVQFEETDQAVDEKVWRFVASSGTFAIGTLNDTFGGGANAISVTRTGTTISSVTLAATTITLNGVAVSDLARLSAANIFTADQQISLAAGNASFTVNANVGTASAARILFNQGGALKSQVGINGSGAAIITGLATSGLALSGSAVGLSANNGTTLHLLVSATEIVSALPVRTPGSTVALLPAGTAGMRAHVTDALAPAFGAAVVGGGAVTVPVYYTGAAWFVG